MVKSLTLPTVLILSTGCVYPTRLDVEPNVKNTEPRIVREFTTPMFEAEGVAQEAETEVSVDLCVYEPNLDDNVSVRMYVNYTSAQPTAHVREDALTIDDAQESDPSIRCKPIVYRAPLCADKAVGQSSMVDLVVAGAWNVAQATPRYRASMTGYTDEIRLRVVCK